MAPLKLPDLKILDDEDIKKLLEIIHPAWPQDLIQIKKLSGGYSCSIHHCYLSGKPEEGVTIRAKKTFAEDTFPLFVPGFEHKAVEVISELGVFAPVLAIFQNGYCYKYIQGEVLMNLHEIKAEEVDNLPYFKEDKLKLIAKKLAQIHSLKMKNEDYSKTTLFERVKETVIQFYPELPDIPEKKMLLEELEELKKYTYALQPEQVLCHGDPHPGNMVWNKITNDVTFVDWELSQIAYQPLDVAYFMESYSFLSLVLRNYELSVLQEKIEKMHKQFLQLYFDEWKQYSQKEVNFEKFHKQVKLFQVFFYLLFVILHGTVLTDKVDISFPVETKKSVHFYYEGYTMRKNKLQKEME